MKEQGELFSVLNTNIRETPTPKSLRDKALEKVLKGVTDEWKQKALQTIIEVANEKRTFTADDIWFAGLNKPREPRALGAIMRIAHDAGYIEPTTNFVPSKQLTKHASPCRVWRKAE